jgi:hypothetical protein
MRKYKINSAVPAARVNPAPDQITLCVIPAGTVLAVTGEPDSEGLVNVQYEGELLRVFQRDLDDLAGRVSSAH